MTDTREILAYLSGALPIPSNYERIPSNNGSIRDLRLGDTQSFMFNTDNGHLSLIDKNFWGGDDSWLIYLGGYIKHGDRMFPIVVPKKSSHAVAVMEPAYISPFLQIMLAASEHFNISSNNIPSKKEELIVYFCNQKLPDGTPISTSQAKMMATFVRPPDAMRGGQKRMG